MTPKSATQAPQVIKLNDSVYELYRPAGTRSMQVVFFHGFQLEDYESAHTKTWTSGDGSVWPQTWLVEKFPEAHVLSVSYNRWVTNASDGGKMDLFNICENLTSDLLSANRNEPRCPIILVGHSFGGLVVKELCVHVSNQMGCERDSNTKSSLKDFLNDVEGIFFYATPHRGIGKEALALFTAENQSLLEYVTTLSTPAARAEFHFFPLSGKYKWRIVGLGENQPIKKSGFLDLIVGGKDLGVTPEASSRYGWRFNIAENTDHITITRPTERTQRNFAALMDLLSEIKPKSVEVERPVHQTQGIPEYHVGYERSSGDVEEKLANMEKLKNARVLGIVGMGGIGKTTLAKALFNKISREFECTCFVDNVKGIKSHKLEDRVLSHFYHHGMQLEQKDANWSTLKGKKTLLVMDDVNSEDQLKNLLKPWDFGVGSRLIITSRDQSILKFFAAYDVYEVDFLRENEAKELFCQHAFGSRNVPEGKQQLEADVRRVLEKCQGLPLTLEVVSSYLKGHDGEAEFWEDTIVKLGNVQDIKGDERDPVWASILRMSYDGLAPVERGMFLEAGTCFFEQPLERALAVWSSEHGSSITGWENLLSKSMVKEVHKKKLKREFRAFRVIEYKEVWVHEHFRDWAKKNSEGHTAIGVDEEAHREIDLLTANEVTAGVTKALRLSDRNQQTKLQLNLLDKVKNLKYLELEGILHEGSTQAFPRLSILRCLSEVPPQAPVNVGFHRPPVEQMEHLAYQVLPLNVNQMNNLAILELSMMKIPKEFPEALENLVNLRILSLCYLEGLDHLPENFGNLSSLKQLELEGLGISTLPDSFCQLSALTDLSIARCSSLKTLPESFGKLSHLEYLWIVSCSILERLPDSFGNLKFLKDLCISSCLALEVLPENLQRLSSLQRLQLNSCSQLSRLPNLDQLTALSSVMINGEPLKLLMPRRKLKLSGQILDILSPGLSDVDDLEVVHPSGLGRLAEYIGTLSTLKRLTIRCRGMEELPEDLGNLSALTDLTLSCRSLERLPESFKRLCSLEKLELTTSRLKRLPDSFGTLGTLKRLTIQCQQLEKLPESLGNLSALTDLTLACRSLGRLPEGFKDLCSLERLQLESSELKKLPLNFGTVSTLKTLTIRCGDLDELPDNFGNLSALTDLTLACQSLERLPESFKDLCSLERLQLESSQLKRLPESFGTVSTLKRLTLRCADLDELPDNFGNLSALADLTLACQSLERLPESFKHLCSLQRLQLESSQLKRLPANFGTISTLKTLTIRCEDLYELPHDFGNLSALTDLTLACRSLKRLPESCKDLSLERWVIQVGDPVPTVNEFTGRGRLIIDS